MAGTVWRKHLINRALFTLDNAPMSHSPSRRPSGQDILLAQPHQPPDSDLPSSVLQDRSHLIFGCNWNDHVLLFIWEQPHCLWVPDCITFKLLSLEWHLCPNYISSLISSSTSNDHCSHLLSNSHTQLLRERTASQSNPILWNMLPDITKATSVASLKQNLKTHLASHLIQLASDVY